MNGDATVTNTGTVTVGALQGRSLSNAAPSSGQVLTWNNSTSKWDAEAAQAVLPTLTNADLWIGNAGNNPIAIAPSGDVGMTNTGLFTVGGIQGKAVSAIAPTDAQVLYYNATTNKWVAASMSGDATVTNTGVVTVSGLQGKQVSNVAATDAQVLYFNGTTNKWVANSMNGDATVTNTGTVTVGALQGRSLSNAAPSSGQVLTWNNSTSKWDAEAAQAVLPTLTNADLWIGNAGNNPIAIAPSGDVGMTNTGLFTVGGIQGKAVSNIAPTDAQVLYFNATTNKWVAISMSGDATVANAGVVTVSGLQGKQVSNVAATDAQVLYFNGTTIVGRKLNERRCHGHQHRHRDSWSFAGPLALERRTVAWPGLDME